MFRQNDEICTSVKEKFRIRKIMFCERNDAERARSRADAEHTLFQSFQM